MDQRRDATDVGGSGDTSNMRSTAGLAPERVRALALANSSAPALSEQFEPVPAARLQSGQVIRWWSSSLKSYLTACVSRVQTRSYKRRRGTSVEYVTYVWTNDQRVATFTCAPDQEFEACVPQEHMSSDSASRGGTR